MSIYSVKGKGWRYDFTLKGSRYTQTGFKTKRDAAKAEAERKDNLLNPPPVEITPTDMGFLDLANRRLDHVKAYNTEKHYGDYASLSKKWVKQWGELMCSEIDRDMVQA